METIQGRSSIKDFISLCLAPRRGSLSWKIWIHKRLRHGSFVNQTYDKRFFFILLCCARSPSPFFFCSVFTCMTQHQQCVWEKLSYVSRLKSFDMIFQLTANPFIAKLIKAKGWNDFILQLSLLRRIPGYAVAYLFLLTLVFSLDVYNAPLYKKRRNGEEEKIVQNP